MLSQYPVPNIKLYRMKLSKIREYLETVSENKPPSSVSNIQTDAVGVGIQNTEM